MKFFTVEARADKTLVKNFLAKAKVVEVRFRRRSALRRTDRIAPNPRSVY